MSLAMYDLPHRTAPVGCAGMQAGHDMDNLDMGGPLIFMAMLGFAHLLVRCWRQLAGGGGGAGAGARAGCC